MNCSNPSLHNSGREHGQAMCQCLKNNGCIKCGSNDFNVRYSGDGNCPLYRTRKDFGVQGIAPCKDVKEEHLEMKCRNCMYEWNEPTKDTEQPPKLIWCPPCDRYKDYYCSHIEHRNIKPCNSSYKGFFCAKPMNHVGLHKSCGGVEWAQGKRS